MTLNEIKSRVILEGLTMSDFAKAIGVERRMMYYRIKKQDKELINLIKKYFNSKCS